MNRSEKIDLLENFSTFLAANGYMDDDWRSEPPYAINEFLKLIDGEEPEGKGQTAEDVLKKMRSEEIGILATLPTSDSSIIKAMTEFATQEKQQARRATIEECILMLEVYGLGQAVEVLKAKLKVEGK